VCVIILSDVISAESVGYNGHENRTRTGCYATLAFHSGERKLPEKCAVNMKGTLLFAFAKDNQPVLFVT